MGFKYFVKEHVKKGIMVQMLQDENLKSNHCCSMSCSKEENTSMLWGIIDHMLLWSVDRKENVVINLCLGFKKEKIWVNYKFSNYDWNYNDPIL